MFNTTHIHQSHDRLVPYEKTVTITEKRAPTDHSIELLNEFQEKAKQNIIDTIVIDNNVMKAVALFFTTDILMDGRRYFLKFILNGKEYKASGEFNIIDHPYIGTNDPKTKFFVMRDFLMPLFSRTISDELMKSMPESIINTTSI
jgi:hypothetical protein